MNPGRWLAPVLLLACSLTTLAQTTGGASLVGKLAPAFTRTDLDGHPIRLASYRGNVVLLNFWATWCGPCLVEMPHFVQWQGELHGLRIVSVSMDDDPAPVRQARTKYALNYPVVMGDPALGKRYGGVYGLPLTLVLDKTGTIRFRHRGETNLNQLKTEIQELLEK